MYTPSNSPSNGPQVAPTLWDCGPPGLVMWHDPSTWWPCGTKPSFHRTFWLGIHLIHLGMGQNPGTFCSPQNSWDLWMFIPLKCIYRYWPIPICFSGMELASWLPDLMLESSRGWILMCLSCKKVCRLTRNAIRCNSISGNTHDFGRCLLPLSFLCKTVLCCATIFLRQVSAWVPATAWFLNLLVFHL